MDEGIHTLRVRGHYVRVHLRPGSGAEPPLLLCNGIGASLETFDPLVAALSPERTVIRFDVPGVGASPAPLLPYRYGYIAWLMTSLLDRLRIPRVDVLGYSWGGGLAQQFAFQNRRRCRRLVLVATTTGSIALPGRPAALSKMLTPRRHRDPGYATDIAPVLYGGTIRHRPWLAGQLLGGPDTRAATSRGYLYQLAAGAMWSSLPWLPLIRQPTLLLFGDDDPIIPLANGRLMSRLLPDAELHVYPDGHLGLLTSATELAAVIDEFLDRPPSGPAHESEE